MQYLLLIYGPESDEQDFSDETMKAYDAFWKHVSERGVIRAGDPELAERVRLTDCEAAACVICVESEADCRAVVEAAWGSIFAP